MATSNKRKYAKDPCYPISLDWVICKEKLLQNDSIVGESFDVENLPGVKYWLEFEFKEIDENSVEETYVYLYLNMPDDMVINVDFNIICKSADFDGGNIIKRYTMDSPGWGSRLCLSNEFFDPEKKFITNDKLVISLKATLDVAPAVEVPPKIQKGESLGWKLWNNEEDTDATIVVNGMEIKVHKWILKRRSAKFDFLFKEPSTKKNNGNKITVKKHAFDTVKEGIMFCYDIQSPETLCAEEARDLLEFAVDFQIMDLKKSMEKFCIENLSVSNVCIFANTYVETEELGQKCFDFLLKCMKDGTAVLDIEILDEDIQRELFFQTFTKVSQT